MNATCFSLTAQKRDADSAKDIRRDRRVPAIVYGYGVENMLVSLSYSDVLRAYREAGQSSLIELKIDKKTVKVLMHDVNIHPVKRTIEHLDFLAVNVKEKTDVNIPFEFVGESPAVKNHGGILVYDHETILLRCLPTEIPHTIEVSLSQLEEIGDSITVADLSFDTEKFEIMDLDPETTIATVMAPRLVEEEEETDEEQSVEVPAEHGSSDESETKE